MRFERRQLRDAFVGELTQGHSHYDRQLRNDVLSLACQIAAANPIAPFIETAFAKHLILFATYPELKSHSPLVAKFKLAHNHEDFELKKLLFNILILLSRDSAFLTVCRSTLVYMSSTFTGSAVDFCSV